MRILISNAGKSFLNLIEEDKKNNLPDRQEYPKVKFPINAPNFKPKHLKQSKSHTNLQQNNTFLNQNFKKKVHQIEISQKKISIPKPMSEKYNDYFKGKIKIIKR